LKYTDYIDRWDEIANIFSREAILRGSFDKYVESKKTKKGTAEVDAAFLQEIERWRELLARNIALRNPDLTQRELNFAIQQTIDRIIFLRICEDRGIEHYGRLMALQNGENVYKRLFQLFRKADDKYNSGLFHFKKEKNRDNFDNLTPNLAIDDKTLKDIFKNLYYPDSPYEFSVLPADILGQVYEKFLSKIIRLTPKHQAKIEEKPEVRKAGGVYYTPTYIVDYIVKNTLGKLVEGKKPGPRGGVSNLRILDPACGSGSFLIGAYQFLLDWHRDEYINDGPDKWSKGKVPRIYQSRKGEWRLTTDERKRILLNNIYGVDIDQQAVEVTKLSLLLKVLEGEDEQSIGKQMSLFQERVLPDLSNNIKCGNSLIGPDFYDHQQISLLDEEEIFRVNTFDWNAEFANVMKDGGFDAVIGNPPWGAELTERELSYLRRTNKEIIVRMIDSFMYFIYQSSQKSKALGYFGMILPDVLLYQVDNEKLRRYVINNFRIKNILNMGDVFDKVSRPSSILVFQNSNPYEFSVLPADILGQVYEKFLSKIIRLTPKHQAKIEEKPEVRKAGGVYYTPTYIVDYIVKNTLGKLVEGKKPGPRGGVSNLRILDPACGSGSFLIGAYQFLLDWHRDEYINDGPDKWSKGKVPRIYQSRKGEWRLTTDERKRILLNNIYGVDIDQQAVEVTKLSLLLKVLEGEDEQSIGKQMSLFQERVLPDLSNNIKCGNSLIGPDFYDHQQISLLDEEEIFRVNTFDWNAEFANVMKDGGFDAVIGNPPWGAELTERELSYLRRTNKEIIVRMIDSFMYFIYQSSQKSKALGYFGMILPDVLLYQVDNEKLRRYVINNFRIKNILNMGDVFDKVSRPSSILVFQNSNPSTSSTVQVLDLASFAKIDKVACITESFRFETINQRDLNGIPGALFITSKPDKYKIWAKVNKIPNNILKEVVDADGIQRGVSPDLKEAFLVDSSTANKFQLEKNKLKKSLTGGVHVKRYFINQPDLWLIYTSRNDDFHKLPNICKYIDQFKIDITCKEVKQNKHPIYSLHRPRKEHVLTGIMQQLLKDR